MPVLITASVDSEDSFEQFMVLRGKTVEEVRGQIDSYIAENDGEEIEIAASQNVHVGDSVDTSNFDVVEITEEQAEFLAEHIGTNFGTGVIETVLGE